jgi:L-arabinose isomerase
MERFLEKGGFKAFTNCFEDLSGLSGLPGLATQRLMSKGYGYGGEGDWKTAAMVRIMKVMGEGREGGCSFMEDYTYNMGETDQVLGAHMLEVCPSIAAQKPRLEVHQHTIGVKCDVGRLLFTAKPGAAINVSPIDMGNRFRILINEVDTVAPPADLPHLPVASALWEPKPNLSVASAAWIHAGGAHHTAYSQAVTTDMIIDFAEMAGVETMIIDNDTTIRGFKTELRHNAAYYMLKRGL